MHMTEVEIQLNHQSKITENVVVRLIINSRHESTKWRREITLSVIISLLGDLIKTRAVPLLLMENLDGHKEHPTGKRQPCPGELYTDVKKG